MTRSGESSEHSPEASGRGASHETARFGQGPGRPPSKRQRILAWLADRGWDCVTEERAEELAAVFTDCEEETRRDALAASGLALAPLVLGVIQDNYQHLDETLASLLEQYLKAREAGDHARVQKIRSAVIRAKEHAELAVNNSRVHALKRMVKTEVVLWLSTWLENPPLFPAWVALRKPHAPGYSATEGVEEDPEE